MNEVGLIAGMFAVTFSVRFFCSVSQERFVFRLGWIWP